MEIDISFTKIVIFIFGGGGYSGGPVSYNFFFEGMGGPSCLPAPLN